MLPPPPAETRLRPMDATLRGLGHQTVREIYGDKRNYSRNDVGPHVCTRTKGLKRRLKKVRRANKRFNRRFARMERAADKLKKFDKHQILRPKPLALVQASVVDHDEGRSVADAAGPVDSIKDEEEEEEEESLGGGGNAWRDEHAVGAAAGGLEVTDEVIRQATTRLSRAREQLRSSTANHHTGAGVMDPFLGVYDLPARPMTSSVRQRMIGGAMRIDLSLDHLGVNLDEGGGEGDFSGNKRGKVWMGLSPEYEQTERWS